MICSKCNKETSLVIGTECEGCYFGVNNDEKLRSQFAASALTGLLAKGNNENKGDSYRLMQINAELYARIAFELADAMLKESKLRS